MTEKIDSMVPKRMEKWIKDCKWTEISIGHSEAKVFGLSNEERTLYLKQQSNDSVEKLVVERDKLLWLKERLPVPEVIDYEVDRNNEYLLITEIEGINASDSSYKTTIPSLMRCLGEGLRHFHSINIKDCPFNQYLESKLAEVKERVEKGLVDEEDFDEGRQGKTAKELYVELLSKVPQKEDVVLTHGDFCMPNIIVNNDKVSGFIDCGRAGVADRYQDLALASRSITSNFGEEYVKYFMESYGVTEVDEEKMAFYQLLDEFF